MIFSSSLHFQSRASMIKFWNVIQYQNHHIHIYQYYLSLCCMSTISFYGFFFTIPSQDSRWIPYAVIPLKVVVDYFWCFGQTKPHTSETWFLCTFRTPAWIFCLRASYQILVHYPQMKPIHTYLESISNIFQVTYILQFQSSAPNKCRSNQDPVT